MHFRAFARALWLLVAGLMICLIAAPLAQAVPAASTAASAQGSALEPSFTLRVISDTYWDYGPGMWTTLPTVQVKLLNDMNPEEGFFTVDLMFDETNGQVDPDRWTPVGTVSMVAYVRKLRNSGYLTVFSAGEGGQVRLGKSFKHRKPRPTRKVSVVWTPGARPMSHVSNTMVRILVTSPAGIMADSDPVPIQYLAQVLGNK